MEQKQPLVWDFPPLETFALNRAFFDIPHAQHRQTLDEFIELLDLSGVWNLLAGVAVEGWALWHIPTPRPLDVIVGLTLMFSGLVAVYGLWLLAICTSFYFIRVDNLRFLIRTAPDTGRWPVQVFSGWLRVVLVTVVPIGMITTFPAMAFRGTWPTLLALQGVGVGLVFAVISRLAWRRNLAHYASARS